MNKTKKDFENWIKEQIDYYAPILGVELNRIDVEYKDEGCFLEITHIYPYLDPTLRYSERAFQVWKEGKMEKDRILHELLHIITDPLYTKAFSRYVTKQEIEDERERLTDTISAIIRKFC